MHQLANHVEQHLVKAFHLPIALGMISSGTALLDAEGSTKFFYQGGCKVDGLVFCHYHQGIPREMVCNHEDVSHYWGIIQLHCGLYAGVV